MSDDRQRIGRTLAMTELFLDVDPDYLRLIANICQPLQPTEGDIIFKENSASDELYVIGRGHIEILIDPSFISTESNLEPVVIATLRQGDVMGEMALVDQGLRSATARVKSTDAYLLKIPRADLMGLCAKLPDLGFVLMQNLAADLALKIRNTDLTLRQYQIQLMYGGKNS